MTRIVADKELPFALKAPNEASRSAIAEADQIVQSRSARFATADALLNGFDEASRKQAGKFASGFGLHQRISQGLATAIPFRSVRWQEWLGGFCS